MAGILRREYLHSAEQIILTPADGNRTPVLVADARRHGERKLRAMTMKEKLQMHREMEEANRERVRRFIEAQKEKQSA
jgi:hypothetical protein